ncbi:MAG: ATP-binding cassette domain-containing protein [Bifidobacteriaceae bacterium]|jgi:ABC-type multidrug transport system fused ATPase/permease subunit|nr:ATP-binding cassette domain-containing protein [Bifidobacteriaceae bacterium]
MIRQLPAVLGPEHQADLTLFLVWAAVYGTLQGFSVSLLVPIARELAANDWAGAWRWIGVLAGAVAVCAVAHYIQAMRGFEVALVVLRTMHLNSGDHLVKLPLGWFAGKTGSVAQIASKGTLSAGGADVRDQSAEALMAQLALVFQDVYLFDDSLRANVKVGRPSAPEEEVDRAAELAGVTEIAERLPGGWDTPVGEAGSALSGGERQRVSVARAILKRAPIVLLDEATAALDPENERYVRRSLDTLRADTTLIVIAHKLSTVVGADQIIVLDEHGGVAETGTHSELLGLDGRYAAFWRERASALGWRLEMPVEGALTR